MIFKKIFLCCFIILLSSCDIGLQEKKNSPPIEKKIDLSKQKRIEIDFSIIEHSIYYFNINFIVNKEKSFDEIKSVIGQPNELSGIKTPVILTIYMKDNLKNNLVFKKEITPVLTSWNSKELSKYIGHCNLNVGDYVLYLDNLTLNDEYHSIDTRFSISAPTNKLKFRSNVKNFNRSQSCPQ